MVVDANMVDPSTADGGNTLNAAHPHGAEKNANVGGDYLPADKTAKLGHAAHDHHHEKNHKKDELDSPRPVNPLAHAVKQILPNAFKGATMLGLFSALFTGVKLAVEKASFITDMLKPFAGAEGSLLAAGNLASIAIAVPLTGALWYGGNAFIKSFKEAEEHNKDLAERKGRGHQRGHAHERGHSHTQSQSPAIQATTVALADESPAFSAPAGGWTNHVRPQGAQSLNPAEIARRAVIERSAAEASVS